MADLFEHELSPLSQEQLDQITGGCGACEADKKRRDRVQNRAVQLSWLAEGDHARGDRIGFKEAMAFSLSNAREAKYYQAMIDARQGTPGHPSALGESSNSAPDMSQLRLQ